MNNIRDLRVAASIEGLRQGGRRSQQKRRKNGDDEKIKEQRKEGEVEVRVGKSEKMKLEKKRNSRRGETDRERIYIQ